MNQPNPLTARELLRTAIFFLALALLQRWGGFVAFFVLAALFACAWAYQRGRT